MARALRKVIRLATIGVLALALQTGRVVTPAHAGEDNAAHVRAAELGWQVFLPGAHLEAPTGVAIDLRGARHAAQWGYVADARTGRIAGSGSVYVSQGANLLERFP